MVFISTTKGICTFCNEPLRVADSKQSNGLEPQTLSFQLKAVWIGLMSVTNGETMLARYWDGGKAVGSKGERAS